MNQYKAEKTEQKNKRYRTGFIVGCGFTTVSGVLLALNPELEIGVRLICGLMALTALFVGLTLSGSEP
jgi:hypothetical protein